MKRITLLVSVIICTTFLGGSTKRTLVLPTSEPQEISKLDNLYNELSQQANRYKLKVHKLRTEAAYCQRLQCSYKKRQ
jgi:hypothetical protein